MSQRVRVRHPGYRTPNTLFTFPASDSAGRDHAHYATIWTACSIFIGNRPDHWLSTSLNGEPRVCPDDDGLICAGDYYLHVPGDDQGTSKVYPVVPNFRAWRYPHDRTPPLWIKGSQNDERHGQRNNFSAQSIAIEHCRITNRQLEVDMAHIIPSSEKLWFTNNEMEDYGSLFGRSGEIVADSFANSLRLRCDAHRLWDKLNFSIIPREDDTAETGVAWFTQVLSDGEELHKYWHRQRLAALAGRPPQYLYARFAWDIFPKLHLFLQSGQERYLTVCGLDGSIEDRRYSGAECRQFTVGQGNNRSASPTKRARSETSSQLMDLEELEYSGGSEASDRGFFASNSLPSSDCADSAVAGMHKPRKRSKHGTKAEAELAWHRYICGDNHWDGHRGRKRFKT